MFIWLAELIGVFLQQELRYGGKRDWRMTSLC